MSAPLLTGCTDCKKISMVWTVRLDRWQGRCSTESVDKGIVTKCGATSWSSTWESQRLDGRAEDQARE